MAKVLHSQHRGPGFDSWLGNSIPHATTKSMLQLKILHATSKTWHSQINKYLKFFLGLLNKRRSGVWYTVGLPRWCWW